MLDPTPTQIENTTKTITSNIQNQFKSNHTTLC